MNKSSPTFVVPLEWRKANPTSHGDFTGLDGNKAVARIYLAVSDISLDEGWHWELTTNHEGLEADQNAGQAHSHIAAAEAAERSYTRLLAGHSAGISDPSPVEAPREPDLVVKALELGSDA
ncbi:hypothetical protein ASG25_13550 [Rhizobium sp. Leaf384]|uniref:hypothetical protein n=1 Tax=unclassified Rhizobium TaxID=2613769 RepID=UPI0007131804|nr:MULTISPECIES: hypothetical protein [unclassified Rhizobium]KQR75661.1 hypothetical protein ASG03_18410 [Rhizobium sp. Leaf341]KQS77626.1 hypothetical protein ASG25_13550 [Rhizobium sp. Leaf384]KQS83746.1 hypothetical protein ASG58_21985 [Rhizobium sp. Leaf383]